MSSMMNDSGPVQYLNPFREKAPEYRDAGWRGTLPLPYKDKHAPPTGWHGHNAPYPSDEVIAEWCSDGKRHNIAIRLAGVDKDYEIIGIDVDHYISGGKEKRGRDQLTALENRYGPLPDTWISSARTDGKSGIRYFRVPRGLAFRGKIAKDIDCISKGNRYAAVWPSVHPNGETYWWFPPGTVPNSAGRKVWSGSLPDASSLPLLPEPWIDFLTRNRMKADAVDRIDMDTASDEIYAWSDDTFHGTDETPMCSVMVGKIAKHKEDIASEPTSHDKITKAHWNIFKLASEGHIGWVAALNEIEVFWANDVISRDKRDLDELKNEIWRSRTNALRKIKAQCDERVKIGAAPIDPPCPDMGCGGPAAGVGDGSGGPPDDELGSVALGPVDAVDAYDQNDLGNAKQLVAMFSDGSHGSAMRWVDGYGWIVWHGGENPHWERDLNGDQLVRRMWFRVYERQKKFVESLKTELDKQIADAKTKGLPITGTAAAVPTALVVARASHASWKKFVEGNGNERRIRSVIEIAKTLRTQVHISKLNSNHLLLGVENGVLNLGADKVELRKAEVSDYITFNTHIKWEQPSKHAKALWNDYLDTFLPNPEMRKIVQIALGHTIVGGNPQKILLLLIGPPNSGKSTMTETMTRALGDYAGTVNSTFFQSHKFNNVLVESAQKRAVMCSEFDQDDNLSVSAIKRTAGGIDKFTQEIKYSRDTATFEPQFVPIIATNSMPSISGADKALENRLFPLRFDVVPPRIDKGMSKVVESVCGTVCLNWLIEGYEMYRSLGGLMRNAAVDEQLKQVMSDVNLYYAFADDVLQQHPNMTSDKVRWQDSPEWCISTADLYSRYETWWSVDQRLEGRKLGINAFGRRMRELGFVSKQVTSKGKYWVGVKFKAHSKVTSISKNKWVQKMQGGSDAP